MFSQPTYFPGQLSFKIIFMHVGVWIACMSVNHAYAWCLQSQKSTIDITELELLKIASYHVDSGIDHRSFGRATSAFDSSFQPCCLTTAILIWMKCNLSVTLIFISVMAENVKLQKKCGQWLFVFLLLSFENWLFISLVHLLIGLLSLFGWVGLVFEFFICYRY